MQSTHLSKYKNLHIHTSSRAEDITSYDEAENCRGTLRSQYPTRFPQAYKVKTEEKGEELDTKSSPAGPVL